MNYSILPLKYLILTNFYKVYSLFFRIVFPFILLFSDSLLVLLHEPCLLLRDGQLAVVKNDGIFGLAQRRGFAMGIDIVALFHVLENILEIGRHSLLLQLIISALCSYLRAGGNEDLEFCVRENGGADVTAIHHDALVLSHLLLLGNQSLSYERYSCNRTHMV